MTADPVVLPGLPAPVFADGDVGLWRADARRLPFPDGSVDLVVTSPPYFGLRSYRDGGVHYAGQLGDEPTPREFVDALLEVTAECVRVLKGSGSLWVNLGDKYSGAQAQNFGGQSRSGDSAKVWAQTNPKNTGIPNKSLMGLPWRYALRCIDELGLILRAEVVWSKPNGLPESVTDRVRRSHEQWFHFTKEPRYFSAVDEIREQYAPETADRYRSGYRLTGAAAAGQSRNAKIAKADGGPSTTNTLGKLPGSVWEVATQPLQVPPELEVDHFAAFPMEWPRRLIRGWSPVGICVECGEGRRPVVDRLVPDYSMLPDCPRDAAAKNDQSSERHGGRADPRSGLRRPGWRQLPDRQATIAGYACACPEPTAPTTRARVLDPFGGTGTVPLVASVMGRVGWYTDLSADYCRLATWRVTDPGERARALQVEKPPPVPAGMASLFDGIEEGVP